MPWRAIARKEVRGLLSARGGKVGLTAVALTFVVGGYLLPTAMENPTTTAYTGYMRQTVVVVLPLFGLLLGYRTIVAERASGRMVLLLSLPHSRLDTVVGKFVGRGLVLVAVVGAGVLAGSALVAYPFGSIEPGIVLGYLLVTLLYGLAFVGIGIGISTLTTSSGIATATTFGVFFLFVIVWGLLRIPLFVGLDYLGLVDGGLPDWALFVHGSEPGMLYGRLLDAFFAGVETGTYLGPDAPWYLGAWPALVVLVAWTVGPIALGYLRFQRTDL